MGTLSVDKLMKTSTGAAEFTLPAADGTVDQVMKTDGAGQLGFTTISADPTMGGDLSGLSSNAQIVANAVGNTEMADDAVGVAELSATGTASATTFLRGDNAWVAPTDNGKILQVITTTKTDVTTSTTSTSFVDIAGFTVDITPSAATSKVLIMVTANMGSGNLYRNQLRLMRDSTPIFIGDQLGSNRARSTWFTAMTDAQTTYNAAGTYLDSPNTTSAITYKLQWAIETGITVYLNRPENNGTDIFKYGTSSSTITVMEVGA